MVKSSASMDKRGASPPERVENDETAPGDEDWPTSTGHFVWLQKPLSIYLAPPLCCSLRIGALVTDLSFAHY